MPAIESSYSKRVAIFIGTRPEAIKMAPIVRALEAAHELHPIVVSTGQHREMLQQVTDLFQIKIDVDLNVMTPNQSLATLSARLLSETDAFLGEYKPDYALVQGDTTTVLMAALACFYRKVPVGHVEAGLRTGVNNNPFPEELNRTLVTPIASLHFAPTVASASNLSRAGVDKDSILITGKTVIDALRLELARQQQPEVRAAIDGRLRALVGSPFGSCPMVLITGHRRENHGAGFHAICAAIERLALRFPSHLFIYPVHLNPRSRGLSSSSFPASTTCA